MNHRTPPVPAEHVSAVRRFNRFHTRLVGALNEHLLASPFSLPQARVLYELANAPAGAPVAAADLGRALGMDAGYLSRLIAGLVEAGLIARSPDPSSGRRLVLGLTEAGRAAFARLDAGSVEEVTALLRGLGERERGELTGAMGRIRRLLGDTSGEPIILLRDPAPGDLGTIVARQARLYAEEYCWDRTFEGLLAEIVAAFVRDFDPARERCWVAEREGEIVGSVFVVRQDDETAKLRMLYVDRAARGMGLGRRLVDQCLAFARERDYRRMVLWTNDVLVSARRIYQAAGFELVEEEPHRSFGKNLVGQYWARDL